MPYKNIHECVLDLEKHGKLARISSEVDPDQEMAEIQRRVFEAGGPAVFYEKVKGSPFPAVSNLFGTMDRARFIFRETLDNVKKLVQLKARPGAVLSKPLNYPGLFMAAMNFLPLKTGGGPVMECETTISALPQIKSWPMDGGSFILLPQVYTENQARPGIWNSNLGMYRIQMSGNQYMPNQEAGLHYQIRRDIGVHHAAALERNEKLRVSIFIGGPPAHTFAAVMYLPPGVPEIAFAGALAGRNFQYARVGDSVISSDADFCITGYVEAGKVKPEGPFGDHLGYYSLKHDFPVMKVEKVYHRRNAVWPFTVVGRPPQEDSVFGALVQEIAGPMVSKEIPGVKAVHAVDAAGVHPLMLAIGSERYVPYAEREPREILTQANAILGYGPCSLAKYLLIAAGEDSAVLDVHDVPLFFQHVLERIDLGRDLHFQTRSTMDTLDYSGTGLNSGSKVVMAAAGPKKRELLKELNFDFNWPEGYKNPKIAAPGTVVVHAPKFNPAADASAEMQIFAASFEKQSWPKGLPLVVLCDDSEFTAKNFNNFLWVTFTRSNPSHDIHGAGSFIEHKHWGCRGPLIIDARIKPHHAPAVEPDSAVVKRVENLAAAGGPLHGIF